jgi:hypothetical protein
VTYSYRAYGVTLASDSLEVPGLAREQADLGPTRITLHLGSEPHWVRAAKCLPSCVERPRPGTLQGDDASLTLTSFGAREFFELAYGDGVRFVIDAAADHVWGRFTPPLTVEDLATYLLGPVMGFILRRQGIMSLHASAACIGGHAVVFCGESEAGKSTTVAALALRGVPVLAEDISPIKEEDGTLCVEPGYPRICLWPDTVEKLFGSLEALPLLTPTWEKRFLALDGQPAKFEAKRKPLGVVYLLAPRTEQADAPRIEDVGMREALLELVQNTYMNWLLDRTQRAAELDLLSRIVERVPVRRIVPHSDSKRIGALCELIVADTERLFAGQTCAAQASDE